MIYRIEYVGEGRQKKKLAHPVKDRKALLALRDSKTNLSHLEKARKGDAKTKAKLLQLAYNLGHVDGPLAGCKSIGSNFFHDVDCYDKEQSEAIRDLILSKKDAIGLVMLEQSPSGGYHLVCRRVPGTTILENQVRVSIELKLEMDTSAHDLQRVVYSTSGSEKDLIYLDDAIFEEPMTPEECEKEFELLKEREARGLEEVPAGAKKANKHYRPWEDSATVLQCYSSDSSTSMNVAYDPEARYNGVLFSDIIQKYWEMFNDGKKPVEGDRNALTFELAMTLRSICGYSLEKLLSVIPNYWNNENDPEEVRKANEDEWRKTIENALKEPRKGIAYRLKQTLAALKSTTVVQACGGTMTTPPPLPKRLPPLIRLLTRNVPPLYKPAVASAVFPALGAHMHGVKFRYWDNVEHEPTFMNILIGGQSIGKGSIGKPIEYIMEDIRLRDIPNRQREADWKQKNPSSKQKKDPRPTDICIQMLIDNLTDAVFNQRIVDVNNNGERYIYTRVDEIEALKKVTSKGSVDEVGLLIRKAFDNALAGQERVGADSVSGIAPLRWNFNASTTPPNARRFFARMVNDGTVSRLDIATIIRDKDDDSDPILGIYDHAFAEDLKPYLDRLDAANGLIECPQAKKLALEIKQQNSDIARLYESDAYRVLSYRANVIAWLKGMLLFVAHGYCWSKEIAEFVRWSQQYNLWCKMLYFGQQLERELREEVEIQHQSGPQNLLELLPDEFSRDQYRQMRVSLGRKGDGESTLRTWATRGYIAYDDVSGRYCKTESYKLKFSKK
jgi:hypothetical protein